MDLQSGLIGNTFCYQSVDYNKTPQIGDNSNKLYKDNAYLFGNYIGDNQIID